MGAKPVNFTWNRQYPRKKQWSLDNLPFSHDWALYVDADERVSPELAEEIAALFANGTPAHNGYFIGFDYRFAGRILRHGQRIFKLALMERDKAYYVPRDDLEVGRVGDLEMHYQPSLKGTTAILKNRMVHDNEEPLHHYFARHNNYSDWESIVRHNGSYFAEGDSQPFLRRYMKPVFARMPFKPMFAFLYSYVFNLGFLDGRAGFDFAIARGDAFLAGRPEIPRAAAHPRPGEEVDFRCAASETHHVRHSRPRRPVAAVAGGGHDGGHRPSRARRSRVVVGARRRRAGTSASVDHRFVRRRGPADADRRWPLRSLL